jgi:hypothetical protein
VWGSRRKAARLGGLVAAVAVLTAPAARADAAPYTVWSCRGPDGTPVPTTAWSHTTVNARAGDVTFADTCAQGGALQVSLAAGRSFDSPATGVATFAAPGGARIVGYELWRSLAVAPRSWLPFYDYRAAVVERPSGASPAAYGCATSGPCRAVGNPADPDAPDNRFSASQSPLEAIALEVSCQRGWCAEPSGIPARATLHRARVVLEDAHAPSARLAGALTEGRSLQDRAALVVGSADRGAGVAAISVAIDGRPVQTTRLSDVHATCREPYTVPQPCPTDVERVFEVDLRRLTEGRHAASGTVVDAAGNSTAWGPVSFTVERPAPPLAAGPAPPLAAGPAPAPAVDADPPPEKPRLRLASSLVQHAPGRVARLRGRLTTAAGAAVASARLAVTARDLAVAERARDTTRRLRAVTTDATGAFTVRIRDDGAQRVTVAFAPRAGAPAVARASATVRTRLSLRAAPTRRLLVKGRVLVMRGRLTGAGRSAAGTLVHVQSIVNGEWTPVGVVRARANGTYRWRYRFVHLTRDTIFPFRTVIERAPGWPWPTERSRTVRVRVDVP